MRNPILGVGLSSFLFCGIFFLHCISLVNARAETFVLFANRIRDQVDAPVFGVDGVSKLPGAGFSAQLYAAPLGAREQELIPIGAPTPFIVSGYIRTVTNRIATTMPGETWQIQMRAWSNASGAITSYENATIRGKSSIFTVVPSNPPAYLSGLRSFQLLDTTVPDPCECSFTTVHTNQSSFNFSYLALTPLALSADGQSLLVRETGYNNMGSFYSFFDNYSIWDPKLRQMRQNLLRAETNGITRTSGWILHNMSADLSVGVATQVQSTNDGPFTIGAGFQSRLPFHSISSISGDGRYVFGRVSSNLWLRLNRKTPAEPSPTIRLNDATSVESILAVSHGGEALLGSAMTSSSKVYFYWTTSKPAFVFPETWGFVPAALSGDGRLVAGAARGMPAYWSETAGLKVLEGTGAINLISFDGQIMAGTSLGAPALWKFPDRKFALTNLIRASGWQGLPLRSIDAMSANGRVLAGAAGPNSATIIWHAEIAFGLEGPALTILRTAANQIEVRHGTKLNLNYQLLSSTDFKSWNNAAPVVIGSGSVVTQVVNAALSSPLFFKVAIQDAPR